MNGPLTAAELALQPTYVKALVLEDRMRSSDAGQAAFCRAEQRDDEDWMEEAARMQARALREVGIEPTQRSLHVLRATALKHPELALYVRNNLCRRGDLQVGDVVPTMPLFTVEDGREVSFPQMPQQAAQGDCLHVVFAGSVS